MSWKSLFYGHTWSQKPPPPAFGEAVPTGEGHAKEEDKSAGTFITPSSLVTFAGATLAITVLTTFVEMLQPSWKAGQAHIWVTASFAAVVGGLLFWGSSADPQRQPKRPDQWALAAFVALVNTAYLTLAALGIPLVSKAADSGSASPKTALVSAPVKKPGSDEPVLTAR